MKRIMIFGRPGSGKSTFATTLSKKMNLPIYHLDKYFYVQNWQERDYDDFLATAQSFVDTDSWIIDGNNTRSLEMRWSQADVVLYFNYSPFLCAYRIFKRWLNPNRFDDRADGCQESISWKLLKYMWTFHTRVKKDIERLKNRYPDVVLIEIRSAKDIERFKQNLLASKNQ